MLRPEEGARWLFFGFGKAEDDSIPGPASAGHGCLCVRRAEDAEEGRTTTGRRIARVPPNAAPNATRSATTIEITRMATVG